MKLDIYELFNDAFSEFSMEDALIDAISRQIDYDEIARFLLDASDVDIENLALEHAMLHFRG